MSWFIKSSRLSSVIWLLFLASWCLSHFILTNSCWWALKALMNLSFFCQSGRSYFIIFNLLQISLKSEMNVWTSLLYVFINMKVNLWRSSNHLSVAWILYSVFSVCHNSAAFFSSSSIQLLIICLIVDFNLSRRMSNIVSFLIFQIHLFLKFVVDSEHVISKFWRMFFALIARVWVKASSHQML